MDSVEFTYLHLKYGINEFDYKTLCELIRTLGPKLAFSWVLSEYNKWMKRTPITNMSDDVDMRNRAKASARRIRKTGLWVTKAYSAERLLAIVATPETKLNLYKLLESQTSLAK